MNDPGLTLDEIKIANAEKVRKASSFETRGLNREAAENFLDTPEGTTLWLQIRSSNPEVAVSTINEYAIAQLRSGLELPRLANISEPLVKVVPSGEPISSHTPFFAKKSAFEDALSLGHKLSDRFGLPIRSEAQVYDIYEIQPKGRVEVFINTIAPTSELDGLVTKPGGAEQILVPNRGAFTHAVKIGQIGNDLRLHEKLLSSKGLAAPIARATEEALSNRAMGPRIRAGKALGAAGLLLDGYEAADTINTSQLLRSRGNDIGADAQLMRFTTRSAGGWVGGIAGFKVGAALGVESGPGLFVTGAVGGVVGAVAGDKLADWKEQRKVFNQQDSQGNTWSMDPGHPERGWRRDARIDNTADGVANAYRGELMAAPSLARELNYKATNASAQLALANLPVPRNPYSLPANETDTRSMMTAHWERNADNGQWQREVTDRFAERGLSSKHMEVANQQRAQQLDAQANAIIAANVQDSPGAMAVQYMAKYYDERWSGPIPETLSKPNANQLMASNGNLYDRNAQGQWVHESVFGQSIANGNIKAELDASSKVLYQALMDAHPQLQQKYEASKVPLTAHEQMRESITSIYRSSGVEISSEGIERTTIAVENTHARSGIDGQYSFQLGKDSAGGYSANSPMLTLQANERGVQQIKITTPVSTAPAKADTRSNTVESTTSSSVNQAEPKDPGYQRARQAVSRLDALDPESQRNVAAACFAKHAETPGCGMIDQVLVGKPLEDGRQYLIARTSPWGDIGPHFSSRIEINEAARIPAEQSLKAANQSQHQQIAQRQEQQQEQQAQSAVLQRV